MRQTESAANGPEGRFASLVLTPALSLPRAPLLTSGRCTSQCLFREGAQCDHANGRRSQHRLQQRSQSVLHKNWCCTRPSHRLQPPSLPRSLLPLSLPHSLSHSLAFAGEARSRKSAADMIHGTAIQGHAYESVRHSRASLSCHSRSRAPHPAPRMYWRRVLSPSLPMMDGKGDASGDCDARDDRSKRRKFDNMQASADMFSSMASHDASSL